MTYEFEYLLHLLGKDEEVSPYKFENFVLSYQEFNFDSLIMRASVATTEGVEERMSIKNRAGK